MTTHNRVIDVLPADRPDRALTKRLLSHLARRRGHLWASLDFPEERIVSREAVQVIAMEQSGRMTAIECVALDGFAGDTEEGLRLTKALAEIERDASLRAPGFHVDVTVSTDAWPNTVETALLTGSLRGWCERHVRTAAEGRSAHVIMVAGTPVKCQVEKIGCPGEPGRLSIARAQPPGHFEAVVHERLAQKLGRLMSAAADRRLLLFEKSDTRWSFAQLRLELEGAGLELPDLNAVTEVWLADTVAWEREGDIAFRLVLRNDQEFMEA